MTEDTFDDFVIALDQAGARFDAEAVAAALAKAGLKIVRVADESSTGTDDAGADDMVKAFEALRLTPTRTRLFDR